MRDSLFFDAAREGKNDWWRYLITVAGIVILAFLASLVLLVAALISGQGGDLSSGKIDLAQFSDTALLLVNMLPFAVVLLWLWISVRFLHKRPFVTLVNPLKRVRWGNLLLSAGLWLFISLLAEAVLYLFNPGNYVWTFEPARFLPFFALSLVLIPIQTSTEELVFRGYLTQGIGLLFRNFWVIWIVPSVLFGLLHSANPEIEKYGFGWMMAGYITTGLLLGYITLRSQGTELALGMHLANNLYATVSTFPGSAIRTPAIFSVRTIDPMINLFVLLAASLLYIVLLSAIRRGKVWQLATVLTLLLSACAPAAAPTPKASVIPLEDCRLSAPGVAVQVAAKCGTLEVYENRAAQSGRKISLKIAVIRATSQNPEPDPLFLLAGGPGQASTEAFVPILPIFDRVTFKRDIVMVDQRGTGGSNRLQCPKTTDTDQIPGKEASTEQILANADACLASLNADTRFYTTEIAAQDLDDVRTAMGYDKINLLGVSYGTRAALTYLNLFPQNVRTITLDSIVPPGWALGEFLAQDAQRAFDFMVERCNTDKACRETFPNTASDFRALVHDLDQYPVDVQLPDPLTGKTRTVHLTGSAVTYSTRLMLYNTETTALLPLLIHQAYVNGDMKPLAAQYLMVSNSLIESISDGMYNSVVCAEDVPLYSANPPAQDSPFYQKLDDLKALCARWPHGGLSEALRNPQLSDTPALLLTGSADPVTPPANSEQAAMLLPNHNEVLLEGLGHNVMYLGCLPKLINDFLESGSAQSLNTTCSAAVKPEPFFLDFTGPKP